MKPFEKIHYGILCNRMPWKYTESLDKIEIPPRFQRYRGYLSWKENLIGNVELQSVKRESNENLDSDHEWLTLSDFNIRPSYQRNGFGKIMLQKVKDFSDVDRSGIVKRIKTAHGYEHMLANFILFLKTQGFKQFDERTFYYISGGEELI